MSGTSNHASSYFPNFKLFTVSNHLNSKAFFFGYVLTWFILVFLCSFLLPRKQMAFTSSVTIRIQNLLFLLEVDLLMYIAEEDQKLQAFYTWVTQLG